MCVQFCFVVFAVSVLREIWEPPLEEPAETAPQMKGWKIRCSWTNNELLDPAAPVVESVG